MATSEGPKNIVLCSDGTGQSGTNARGTNVWKIRMAVDRHDHLLDESKRRQIVFYDAGVGTSALSVKKTLGNAFGYGLAENMRELYTSLATTYNEGDYVYIFGFSRGAFTARSLAGMISDIGIIDGRRDSGDLDKLVRKAYDAYRGSRWGKPIEKFKEKCKSFKNHKGEVEEVRIFPGKVHFVGVWDTVDAYGMPIDELNILIYKWILGFFKRPHQDQLTENMTYAFQAIAIDEDRKSFAPTMYDEKNIPEGVEKVEQVWFAGAHSNVGGGYPRQGLSDEALEWMMTKAEQCGLRFAPAACEQVHRERDANSMLYDQRSGPGVIWRYKPRNVQALCEEAGIDRAKIHVSALDRIELGTAGYGPITLPDDFEVVGYGQDDEQRGRYAADNEKQISRFAQVVKDSVPDRQAARSRGESLIKKRTSLYYIFLAVLFAIVFFAIRFHNNPEAAARYKKVSRVLWVGETIAAKFPSVVAPTKRVLGWAQAGAEWVMPFQMLDPFVAEIFEKRPEFVVAILLVGLVLFLWHRRLVRLIRHHGRELWRGAFDLAGGRPAASGEAQGSAPKGAG